MSVSDPVSESVSESVTYGKGDKIGFHNKFVFQDNISSFLRNDRLISACRNTATCVCNNIKGIQITY